MNIGERKIFVDISGIPIYTDIEEADMHSAKRYEEVRGMDYKEILEEQLLLLREIAQKRRCSLSEYCEISKNMVEIVNCLNSL